MQTDAGSWQDTRTAGTPQRTGIPYATRRVALDLRLAKSGPNRPHAAIDPPHPALPLDAPPSKGLSRQFPPRDPPLGPARSPKNRPSFVVAAKAGAGAISRIARVKALWSPQAVRGWQSAISSGCGLK